MTDTTSGRFDETPSGSLARAANIAELAAAPHLWEGLGLADLAHLIVLHRANLVDATTAMQVAEAIRRLLAEPMPSGLDPALGDVYTNRMRILEDRTQGDAAVLHTGRARREATTVAWHLACRSLVLDVGLALAAMGEALTAVAGEHRAALMPDFTYLHHAQPTTLGHYLLGFAHPVARDVRRAHSSLDLLDRSPAATGSVNGTRLGLDRRLAARLLEFDGLVEHTRDAMWAVDTVLEPASMLVMAMLNLDRLAEDLQIWTTHEFGFVELADGHSRQSVIMPQKRNPYALTRLRGQARSLIGTWTGLAASLATPSGQPDNRVLAYSDLPSALAATRDVVALAADVITGATFDTARMRDSAGQAYAVATDVADELTRSGLDNRDSHRIVGAAVRRSAGEGSPLTAAAVMAAAEELGFEIPASSQLDTACEPADAIAHRTTEGGAGEESMAVMIDSLTATFAAESEFFAQHPQRGLRQRLEARIEEEIR